MLSRVDKNTPKKLKSIAEALGYIYDEEGSTGQLLDAIASGEILLVSTKKAKGDWRFWTKSVCSVLKVRLDLRLTAAWDAGASKLRQHILTIKAVDDALNVPPVRFAVGSSVRWNFTSPRLGHLEAFQPFKIWEIIGDYAQLEYVEPLAPLSELELIFDFWTTKKVRSRVRPVSLPEPSAVLFGTSAMIC